MNVLKLSTIVLLAVGHSTGQERQVSPPKTSVARIEVIAFDTRGKFLGTPGVLVFESRTHTNFADKFHNGIADQIPFGFYKIEARLPGYYSEIRDVAVYQQKVVVVLGLPFGVERPLLRPTVRGTLLGSLPPGKKTFVKLTGIFSSASEEALIGPDGEYSFAGLPNGLYLLLVISEDGILASRTINIPDPNADIEVK